jgi:cytochrome b561
MPEAKAPNDIGAARATTPFPAASSGKPSAEPRLPESPAYSPVARALHWLTVAFVAVMVPVGLVMTSRAERNIWDELTNALYSSHKLAGVALLALVIVRLVYRFRHGAPPDEPALEPWQKVVSHLTHWAIYALLLAVPLLGWIGVSLYPALDIFGLFKLPGLVSPNQPASSTVFNLHKLGAFALVGLVALHVGAAFFHHLVRKDGVLRRMLPGLRRRL